MLKELDQEKDDIIEEGDDKSSEQSTPNEEGEEKKEPMTMDQATDLIRALQKGYTLTRQDLAELKSSLSSARETTEPNDGDEYVTVSKLKEVLQESQRLMLERQTEASKSADKYLDEAEASLMADGVIKNNNDFKEIMQFALDTKENDVYKAAKSWTYANKLANSKSEEVKNSIAKTKARQEEGSKIGDAKNIEGKSEGVKYSDVMKMDW